MEIPILQIDPEGERRHLARLKKHRAERDAGAVGGGDVARSRAASRGIGNEHDAVHPRRGERGRDGGRDLQHVAPVYGEYKERVVV